MLRCNDCYDTRSAQLALYTLDCMTVRPTAGDTPSVSFHAIRVHFFNKAKTSSTSFIASVCNLTSTKYLASSALLFPAV